MNTLRHAYLRIARQPLSNLLAIACLALGLATSMIVYAVASGLFAQSSLIPRGAEVQLLHLDVAGGGVQRVMPNWSYPGYRALRDAVAPDWSAIAVTRRPLTLTMQAQGAARAVNAEVVSPGYFDALGVAPLLGPTLAFDASNEDAVDMRVWIAHALWRDAFGADVEILGKPLTLQGESFTVAGVLPKGFSGLSEQAMLWVPISAAPSVTFANRLKSPTSFWHEVFIAASHLKSANLEARLSAAAEPVAAAINLRIGAERAAIKVQHAPWTALRIDPVAKRTISVVGLCAALLLAVVTVNLVVLSLVRLSERRRELNIRLALGASRGALLLTVALDTVLLVVCGVAVAWMLGSSAMAFFTAFDDVINISGNGHAELRLGRDALVVGTVLGVVTLIAVLVGLVRALFKPGTSGTLSARGEISSLGRQRLLAGTQFALATALTLAASVAALSGWRAMHVPLGFDLERVLTARVSVPESLAPADGISGFLARLNSSLAEIPGVEHAATAACLPVHGGCDNVLFEAVPRATTEDWPIQLNLVAGDYFAALGIKRIEGRWLNSGDDASGAPVAVISAAAAKRYFPGRSPVGYRVHVSIGWPEDPTGATIVGVVDDVLDTSLDAAPEPMIYLSALQAAYNDNMVIVRGAPEIHVESLAPAIGNRLLRIQPELAMWDVATMEARFDGLTARRRLLAVIIGALALVSLAVAATGIFAVFELIVRRRRQEFGVRMALGATGMRLRGTVLIEALLVAGNATLIGLALGIAATIYAAHWLPGISLNAGTVTAVCAVMLSVAIVACWWPARQAASVNPNIAIGVE